MLIILYLISSICVFLVLRSYILGFLYDIEEESSTVFGMTMINKLQKDIKSLSVNKIFKRNLFIVILVDNEKKTEFVTKGCNNKEINHPLVFGETIDGKIAHTNLTHSPVINGNKTILVDKDSSSFINSDVNMFNFDDYPQVDNANAYNVKVSNQLVNNVVESIEKITGKELKNKKLEYIKSKTIFTKEPVDKL